MMDFLSWLKISNNRLFGWEKFMQLIWIIWRNYVISWRTTWTRKTIFWSWKRTRTQSFVSKMPKSSSPERFSWKRWWRSRRRKLRSRMIFWSWSESVVEKFHHFHNKDFSHFHRNVISTFEKERENNKKAIEQSKKYSEGLIRERDFVRKELLKATSKQKMFWYKSQ